jgi:hypothetical protein
MGVLGDKVSLQVASDVLDRGSGLMSLCSCESCQGDGHGCHCVYSVASQDAGIEER